MSQPLVSVWISVQSVCRKAVKIICILQQSYNTETIFIKSLHRTHGELKCITAGQGRAGRGGAGVALIKAEVLNSLTGACLVNAELLGQAGPHEM